jgi:hypothetical protein
MTCRRLCIHSLRTETPAIGLCWLATVAAGYSAFVFPGVVLHGCCVLDALARNPWTTGRTSVVRP